jgi:hypothetical protein
MKERDKDRVYWVMDGLEYSVPRHITIEDWKKHKDFSVVEWIKENWLKYENRNAILSKS